MDSQGWGEGRGVWSGEGGYYGGGRRVKVLCLVIVGGGKGGVILDAVPLYLILRDTFLKNLIQGKHLQSC